MSEIALEKIFFALARCKDEQFLSTTKSKILCAIELCSICMLKPKKIQRIFWAQKTIGFLVNHMLLKWSYHTACFSRWFLTDKFLYSGLPSAKMHQKYRKGIFCIAYTAKPLRYLLLHRKLHWKGWEFPKGGSLAREKPENTVKRELMEETRLRAIKIKQFPIKGSFIYDKKTQSEWKAKGFKYVLFSAEVKKGKVRISKREHDRYKWCTYRQALRLLSWPERKKCIKLVNRTIKS